MTLLVPGESTALAPRCDLCGKTMARVVPTPTRDDGAQMRVHVCECGARTTHLWMPVTKR